MIPDPPKSLPPFPVDDHTLTLVEDALTAAFEVDEDGNHTLATGEFTLSRLLDFMSGVDESRSTHVGEIDGIPVREMWDARYSEHDVIRALVAEVRALRDARKELHQRLTEAVDACERRACAEWEKGGSVLFYNGVNYSVRRIREVMGRHFK